LLEQQCRFFFIPIDISSWLDAFIGLASAESDFVYRVACP